MITLKTGDILSRSKGIKIAFITEGNSYIGMGHIYETFNLADYLNKRYQVTPVFYLPKSDPFPFRSDYEVRHWLTSLNGSNASLFHALLEDLAKHNIRLIVINTKKVHRSLLNILSAKELKIVCIDELGSDQINADIVINGSVVKNWHSYSPNRIKANIFLGSRYKLMNPRFSLFHKKEKRSNIKKKVVVAMGGADRTGATVRILDSLRKSEWEHEFVFKIGPAFKYLDQLKRQLYLSDRNKFSIVSHIDDIAEFYYSADLLISSGGNILYEIATVGTPGIVLWEDPHEQEQAITFEEYGVVRNLGSNERISGESLNKTINDILNDIILWNKMSIAGKNLLDGAGISRCAGLIMEQINS